MYRSEMNQPARPMRRSTRFFITAGLVTAGAAIVSSNSAKNHFENATRYDVNKLCARSASGYISIVGGNDRNYALIKCPKPR